MRSFARQRTSANWECCLTSNCMLTEGREEVERYWKIVVTELQCSFKEVKCSFESSRLAIVEEWYSIKSGMFSINYQCSVAVLVKRERSIHFFERAFSRARRPDCFSSSSLCPRLVLPSLSPSIVLTPSISLMVGVQNETIAIVRIVSWMNEWLASIARQRRRSLSN